MSSARLPLLIPSEIRSREFDAKLLLACLAAERGLSSIVGSRVEMHLSIADLPRGIYVAKDVRHSSRRIFGIMRNLGHAIVALDEEALLFYSRQAYLKRRVSAPVVRHARLLFAWGPENAAAWRECSDIHDVPIMETGNPRIDMMRPELRPYFDDAVAELRRRFGRFILVNTNFGSLNHYIPNLTTLRQPEDDEEASDFPREGTFEQGLAVHRHLIFRRFLELVPQLCQAFPDLSIVVRPHPAESPDIWLQAGANMPNLQVLHEGGVVPWLLAAEAVIHNSCTTGLEAYLLGTPVVAFRPAVSERFDLTLPNELSHPAWTEGEVIATLRAAVEGKLIDNKDDQARRRSLIDQYVASIEGPLACERILDHLQTFDDTLSGPPLLPRRVVGRLQAQWRRRQKLRNVAVPGHKNNADYTRHRFPPIALAEVEARIARLQRALQRFPGARARQRGDSLFEIGSA